MLQALKLPHALAEVRDVAQLRAIAEVKLEVPEVITWKIKTASGLWLVPPYRDMRVAGRPKASSTSFEGVSHSSQT